MELSEYMRKILDVGIALTAEKDYNCLLELILKESMDITACDAGTLYIVDGNVLRFKIMRNRTMNTYSGGKGEEIDLPPVPMKEENICSYTAIHKKIVNIEDVYYSTEFDFKGPKNYDKITGYHTKSMLVFPLVDHEEKLHGVIQLINAKNDNDEVIAFDRQYEYIVYSLASQASVTLANVKHIEEMKAMFNSMAEAFTTAIDERTPYNANHTKNVAKYTRFFIDYLNALYEEGKTWYHFGENEREQIILAARLHDIGKMTVPLEVMNKAQRLGSGIKDVMERLEKIRLWLKIDYLEKIITEEEWIEKTALVEESKSFVKEVNVLPFLDDDMLDRVNKLGNRQYITREGEIIPFITAEEKYNLSIRKGTLSQKERKVMENHVVTTSKILSMIRFGKEYEMVATMAGQHHEFLDGSGYPEHLKGDKLCTGVRLLTIMDIFDSLISTDRPYKKVIPKDRALSILNEMAGEGKLDGELVNLWKECILETDTVI